MTDSQDRNPVEVLADEFVGRFRRGERPALTEYTDKHPELADEIRELFPLLVEMEDVRSIDDSSSSSASASLKTPDLEQLGDYRMIREIGRGGMGIVYEAEQVSLGRHVAVKVLPKELLENPKQRARFQREAKAAAKLHHTNIVPVFGVGEDEGLGYYVMQFIQGLALDEVLDELKRMKVTPGSSSATLQTGELQVSRRDVSAADVARSLLTGAFHSLAANDNSGNEPATAEPPPNVKTSARAETPLDDTIAREHEKSRPHTRASDVSTATGRLSDTFALSDSSIVLTTGKQSTSGGGTKKPTYWESIAKIGVQVASALEYAHSQGVLHRDIKPGNLLLDLRGAVWVTDFGLAKLDDDRNLTQSGDILGTLRYMAPESFKGETDPRSEVYSLGLTLYELLAFRPACDQTNRHRVVDQVLSAQIEPLNKLNAQIPHDLVTIVHKAIDRHPEDRYQTAEALADDLQRFIDDEPIRARPMSSVERFGRWCRRNPVLATATSIAALALTAVAVISTQFAGAQGRAAAELRKTVDQLDQKTSQLTNVNSELTQTNDEMAEANNRLRAEEERSRQLISQLRRQSATMAVEKGSRLISQKDTIPGMLWLTRALELAEEEPNLAGFSQNIRRAIAASQARVPQLVRVVTPDHSIVKAVHSPNGRFSAVTGWPWPEEGAPWKNHITICDNQTGKLVGHTVLERGPTSLDFTPDGGVLLICGNGPDDRSSFLMTLGTSSNATHKYELPKDLVPIQAVFGQDETTVHLLAGDLQSDAVVLASLNLSDGQILRTAERTIRKLPLSFDSQRMRSYNALSQMFVCDFNTERSIAVTATGGGVTRWNLIDEEAAGQSIPIDDVATDRVYSMQVTPASEAVLLDYATRLALYRLADGHLLWEIPFEPQMVPESTSIRTGPRGELPIYAPRPTVFSEDGRLMMVYEPRSNESRSRLEVRSTETGHLLDTYHDMCRNGRAGLAWLHGADAFVLGTRGRLMVFRLPAPQSLAIDGRFRRAKINQTRGDVVANGAYEARSFRDIQTGRVRVQLSNDLREDRRGNSIFVITRGDTLIQRFTETVATPSAQFRGDVKTIEVYDSHIGEKRCEYHPRNARGVTTVSPSGRLIAHSSRADQRRDPRVRFVDIYDADEGTLLNTIEAVEPGGSITELAFSEDDHKLAVAYSKNDGRVTMDTSVHVDLWNMGERQVEPTRTTVWQDMPSGTRSLVTDLQFDKRGDRLLVKSTNGHVWVLNLGNPDWPARIHNKARQAAMLPHGDSVVVLNTDGRVQLVDVETKQALPLLVGGETAAARMILSSDGATVCALFDSDASPFRCWPMPVAVSQPAAELRSLLQTASQLELTEQGDIVPLAVNADAPLSVSTMDPRPAMNTSRISRCERFAVDLLDRQQWATAILQLEQLIEQNPRERWARLWRIRCLVELDQLELAEAGLEQLAGDAPGDLDQTTAIAASLERRIDELDASKDELRIAALRRLSAFTSLGQRRQMELRTSPGATVFRRPDVIAELGLTAEQRKKVLAITRVAAPKYNKIMAKVSEERDPESREKLIEQANHVRADAKQQAIDEILTDEQRKKWKDMLGEAAAVEERRSPEEPSRDASRQSGSTSQTPQIPDLQQVRRMLESAARRVSL